LRSWLHGRPRRSGSPSAGTGLRTWHKACIGVVVALVPVLTAVPTPVTKALPGPVGRPNVLIIVTDDQRADSLDIMRRLRERLIPTATNFTNAFATTPLCCPSRASILTGRYMHNHKVYANSNDATANLEPKSMLQYYLKQAGYETAMFGKFFNGWPLELNPPHFDQWAVTSYRYYGAKFNIQGKIRHVNRYSTSFVSDKAANFIRKASKRTDPWFAYVAPVAAHAPFEPDRRYAGAAVTPWERNPAITEGDRSDKPRWVQDETFGPRSAASVRRQQLRTLLTADDMIGRLLRILEENGEAENTLVFFLSDNGYFWGEHGLDDKRLPYLPSVRIPLIVRWPGVFGRGATDDRMVATIDVAPTVLSAANIVPDKTIDGRSLAAPWDRQRLLLEYERDNPPFEGVPDWAALLTRDHQYVEYYSNAGGPIFKEYYDLSADAWQLTNLLGDDDTYNDPPEAVIRALREQLRDDRNCAGTTCP
jgi:arylsulfatase A-like enzyme